MNGGILSIPKEKNVCALRKIYCLLMEGISDEK